MNHQQYPHTYPSVYLYCIYYFLCFILLDANYTVSKNLLLKAFSIIASRDSKFSEAVSHVAIWVKHSRDVSDTMYVYANSTK